METNLKPLAIWQQRLALLLAASAVFVIHHKHGVTSAGVLELPQIMPLRRRLFSGLVHHVAWDWSTEPNNNSFVRFSDQSEPEPPEIDRDNFCRWIENPHADRSRAAIFFFWGGGGEIRVRFVLPWGMERGIPTQTGLNPRDLSMDE